MARAVRELLTHDQRIATIAGPPSTPIGADDLLSCSLRHCVVAVGLFAVVEDPRVGRNAGFKEHVGRQRRSHRRGLPRATTGESC